MKLVLFFLLFYFKGYTQSGNDSIIIFKHSLALKLLENRIDTSINKLSFLYIEKNSDTFYTLTYFEINELNLEKLLKKRINTLYSISNLFKIKNKNIFVLNEMDCFLYNIPLLFCIENTDEGLKFAISKNINNKNLYTEDFKKIDKKISVKKLLTILQNPKYKTIKELEKR